MLTFKQIDSLPKGTFSNSFLRSKFGTGHGHVVAGRWPELKQRIKGAIVERQEEDYEFIGNRRQWKFRRHNPLRVLASKSTSVTATTGSRKWWRSIINFIRNLFNKYYPK